MVGWWGGLAGAVLGNRLTSVAPLFPPWPSSRFCAGANGCTKTHRPSSPLKLELVLDDASLASGATYAWEAAGLDLAAAGVDTSKQTLVVPASTAAGAPVFADGATLTIRATVTASEWQLVCRLQAPYRRCSTPFQRLHLSRACRRRQDCHRLHRGAGGPPPRLRHGHLMPVRLPARQGRRRGFGLGPPPAGRPRHRRLL